MHVSVGQNSGGNHTLIEDRYCEVKELTGNWGREGPMNVVPRVT